MPNERGRSGASRLSDFGRSAYSRRRKPNGRETPVRIPLARAGLYCGLAGQKRRHVALVERVALTASAALIHAGSRFSSFRPAMMGAPEDFFGSRKKIRKIIRTTTAP